MSTNPKSQILLEISAQFGALTTIDDLQSHMNALYNDAQSVNDQTRMALIEQTWERMQQITAQNDAVIDLLIAARDVAEKLTTQRDELADKFGALESAVIAEDDEHPLVANLISSVHESAYDKGVEDGLQFADDNCYYHDAAVESIVDDIQYLLKRAGRSIPESRIYQFFYLIDKGELTDSQLEMLADLLETINLSQKWGAA